MNSHLVSSCSSNAQHVSDLLSNIARLSCCGTRARSKAGGLSWGGLGGGWNWGGGHGRGNHTWYERLKLLLRTNCNGVAQGRAPILKPRLLHHFLRSNAYNRHALLRLELRVLAVKVLKHIRGSCVRRLFLAHDSTGAARNFGPHGFDDLAMNGLSRTLNQR